MGRDRVADTLPPLLTFTTTLRNVTRPIMQSEGLKNTKPVMPDTRNRLSQQYSAQSITFGDAK